MPHVAACSQHYGPIAVHATPFFSGPAPYTGPTLEY